MLDIILQLISEGLFPIACVIGLAFFIWNIYNQSVKREDKLMSELAENRKVNQQAIETLAVYNNRLEVIEVDIKDIKNHIIE